MLFDVGGDELAGFDSEIVLFEVNAAFLVKFLFLVLFLLLLLFKLQLNFGILGVVIRRHFEPLMIKHILGTGSLLRIPFKHG